MAEYNLGTASGRIEVDGSGAAEGFSVARAAADSFFAGIQAQADSLKNLGDNLTKIGAVSTAGFGLAVNAAANFEQGLSGIEAVSGATEEQMDRVREAALRIGKDTVYSATEAAQAFEEIIKAGVSVEDALSGAADAVVALAAAGGVALPEAATIASNALNNFNLKGEDMAHVADLIAGAANASAIDVSQFGMSLSQAGAVANLTGLSFDDLAVAIAEMGQAGIKGSDAGTSIKTFLTNLIPTTQAQIKEFERLGLVSVGSGKAMAQLASMGIKPVSNSYNDVKAAIGKYIEASGGAKVGTAANVKETNKLGSRLGVLKNQFFDAEGNAKNFADIQGELAEATKGMTREQKLQSLELLFGSDAIRAAAVFADQGADGFNNMADAMGKVTAAQVAATRLDNLKGSLEQLKGSLETAGIIIGSVFLPAVRKIVDAVTAIVNVFNNAPQGVQTFITALVGVGGGLSLVAGIAIKLAFVLGPLLARFLGLLALKQVFSIFTAGFGALRSGTGVIAAITAVSARAGVVFGRFAAIGRFMIGVLTKMPAAFALLRGLGGIIFGPIGLAIGLVITALVLLYKHFEPFRSLVNNIGNAIKSGFLAALDGVKLAIASIVAGFKGLSSGGGVLGFFNSVGKGARVLWNALLQVGAAFRDHVMPALRAAGGQIWAQLQAAMGQIGSVVRGELLPALRQLGVAFAPLMPYVQQFGAVLLGAVGILVKITALIVGGLLLGLIKLAEAFVTYVLPAIISFVAWITGGLIAAVTTIVSVVTSVVAAITSVVAGIVGFFTGAAAATSSGAASIGGGLQSILGFFVSVFTAVKDFVVTVFTAIWTFIVFIGTTIATAISTFLAFIGSIWSAFWNSSFGQLVQQAVGLVVDIIKLALSLLYLLFAAFVAGVRIVWGLLWNYIIVPVIAAWNAVKAAVSAGIAGVRATISEGMAYVRQRVSEAWAGIKGVVTSVMGAIKSAISAAWNAIKSATAAAWNAIKAAISGPLQAAKSFVLTNTAGIRAAISAAWNYVKSVTSSAWQAFVTTISSKISAAMAKVRSIKGQIVGALSGAASWLVSAGRNVVQGLINGISGMIGAARAKVQELAGIVKSAAANLLKLGSPSRLFEQFGKWTVEGFIIGVDSQLGAAAKLFDTLVPDSIGVTAAGARSSAPISVTLPQGGEQAKVHQEVKVYYPLPERQSKAIDDSLQLAGAFI
jgi:phage-related protein